MIGGGAFRGGGEAAILAEGNHKSAALSGAGVSLVAKQCKGVLYGDGADVRFRRKGTFGGQLAAIGVEPVYDIVAQCRIQLEIHGALFSVDHVLHLVI